MTPPREAAGQEDPMGLFLPSGGHNLEALPRRQASPLGRSGLAVSAKQFDQRERY